MKRFLLLVACGLLSITSMLTAAAATANINTKVFSAMLKNQGDNIDPLFAQKLTLGNTDGKPTTYARGVQLTAAGIMGQQLPLFMEIAAPTETSKKQEFLQGFFTYNLARHAVTENYTQYFIPQDGCFSQSLQIVFNSLQDQSANLLQGDLVYTGAVNAAVQAFDIIQYMLNCYFDGLKTLAQQYCLDHTTRLVFNTATKRFTSTDPLSILYNHMIAALPASLAEKDAVIRYISKCAQDCNKRYLIPAAPSIARTAAYKTGKTIKSYAAPVIASALIGACAVALDSYTPGATTALSHTADYISTPALYAAGGAILTKVKRAIFK